jgi:polyphosphate kinase 2 (PPK2 family)
MSAMPSKALITWLSASRPKERHENAANACLDPLSTAGQIGSTSKGFSVVEGGRQNRKQRRDDNRFEEIDAQVRKMAQIVAKYQKQRKAPTQVILYLEGLDCAGKSSTGMLICQALEMCGYSVSVAQHNRPPTPERKAKPWTDRIRFEYPSDMYSDGNDDTAYSSLVWDRGPV